VTLLTNLGFAQDGPRDSLSAGPRFHWETSFSEMGIKGESIGWGQLLPLYKSYDSAPKTRLLPPASTETGVAHIIRKRKSVRSFVAEPLSLEQLSQILLSGDGVTQVRGGVAHRAAPSGGAKYPIEIYVIAADVDSLLPGLYHFQVADSTLELLHEGDLSGDIHYAANLQDAVGASPATLILSARFARSTEKYADRGYRYTYIEAGAIFENIQLQAVELGLGTVPVGAFNDDAVNALLDIDGAHEAAILIIPLGVPATP
jgi:SagB-type dehydrogenase family enzyme